MQIRPILFAASGFVIGLAISQILEVKEAIRKIAPPVVAAPTPAPPVEYTDLVQYSSDADYEAAKFIADYYRIPMLKTTSMFKKLEPTPELDPPVKELLFVIGKEGPFNNLVVNQFQYLDVLPRIMYGPATGNVRSGMLRNLYVVNIAGWDTQSTLATAKRFVGWYPTLAIIKARKDVIRVDVR